MLIPVILSGGIGSRLWPLSREAHPKPFIKLSDGQSILQKTYQRALSVLHADDIITVTNRDLFFSTKDEFKEIEEKSVRHTFLSEPVRRNSAAAIAVAAYYVREQHGPDCTLLIMPADHMIDDEKAFSHAVHQAQDLASKGKLVTFGIKPSSPQTGFGYIEASGYDVKQFVEKPDLQTAEDYLARGNFFWNSGMFCMRAGSFLDELSHLAPDIADQASKCIPGAQYSSGEGWQNYEIQQDDFEHIRSISVDYAVFEKSDNIAVVSCDIGWSDIGSWTEFGSLFQTDQNQNNVKGRLLLKDTYNCSIQGDDRLIATLGIHDLIIADTADALLIAHKEQAQNVCHIVSELKSRHDPVYREFPAMRRSWGTSTIVQEDSGLRLKHIEIRPGAGLTLHAHKHQSKHWVVVRGTAFVTNGEEQFRLKSGQSACIPPGKRHGLKNPESEPLILIEVQCGEYPGEDDMTRYAYP